MNTKTNRDKQFGQVLAYFINTEKEKLSLLPTIPVPLICKAPLNYKKYRVLTLLDSGSSTNWIAKELLEKLEYVTLGSTKLDVHTLSGKTRKKFKLVEVYYKKNEEIQRIVCYVNDSFTQNLRVPGMLDHIKTSSTEISEEMLNSIVDPSTAKVSHSDLSEGIGLVLCQATVSQIRKGSPKHLEDIDILLEPTIFGTVISGYIPEYLKDQVTSVCNMSTIPTTVNDKQEPRFTESEDYELKQDLQFLGDQEQLGICTE